ncbi:Protein CBG17309 [Caenorhabditis briggsae]|uniref:Protein CBG17309 n=1 Tax=Caenorhabditis briggsae TaxID=6238 RepID=A8XQT4_CAEBR|nr:Protein CBG17309 [Caenorhabditis briggsae]CAP35009.2 Protein CBG17309 [Caenorhabditis briggsae]
MRSGYGHGTVGFHIEGKDVWDGVWDNYFELYLQIIHNCNSYDRPFNTYYYYMGNFRITGGEYTRTYNINITNAGWKSTNVAKIRRLGYAEFNNESSGLGVPMK